jgi:uncharacterized membrane protein
MVDTTFNKPPGVGSYAWLHVLNVLLLVGLWLFTMVMYERLPDQIPAHVGPSGVTRWTPRESGVWWVLPLLGSFHAVLMYVLSTLANSGAAGINVPQKKRLLALPPEAQRYAMQPLRAFMFGMATWLLTLMLWVQIQLYRIATARAGDRPTGGLLAGTFVLTAAVFVGMYALNRAIRRRIDEWEARQQA